MTERDLWTLTRKNLGPYGRLVRIESPITPGTLDVVYCLKGHAGWVELKHLSRWPKRASSLVRFPKLTYPQVNFLEGWYRAGGLAFLLIQVERTYLLVDGRDAALVKAGLTEHDLHQVARVAEDHFPTHELLEALCRRT